MFVSMSLPREDSNQSTVRLEIILYVWIMNKMQLALSMALDAGKKLSLS